MRNRVQVALSHVPEMYEDVYANAHILHTKRKLRTRAYKNLCEQGLIGRLYDYTHKVKAKLKVPEWAKPGKYPRLIGDYSTPGSLLGGLFAEIAKGGFLNIGLPQMKLRYCKSADVETLDDIFQDMFGNTDNLFCFFSDDGGIKINGKVF